MGICTCTECGRKFDTADGGFDVDIRGRMFCCSGCRNRYSDREDQRFNMRMAASSSSSGSSSGSSTGSSGGGSGGSSSVGCGCLLKILLVLVVIGGIKACCDKLNASMNEWTPLMECVEHNPEVKEVADRIELGDDVNAKGKDGETAIALAAKSASKEVVELLLKHGANLDVANTEGVTPVMYAAARKDAGILALIISKANNAAAKDQKGRDALMYALEDNFLLAANATLLLNAGCDVNAVNEDGCTPLILCFRGEAKDSKWEFGVPLALLKTGKVKVNAADKEGNTALMFASMNNYNDKFLEYLLACKASVNAVNNDGDTALILAVKKNHKNAVKVLMKHGADPDLKNKAGESARSIAKSNEDADMLRLLK